MNPLIKAIINKDVSAVKALKDDSQWQNAKDALGFTARELANFLGLENFEVGHPFNVQLQEESASNKSSLRQFERMFNISYCKYLRFDSYASLTNVIKKCPYILRSSRIAADNYKWMEQYKDYLSQGYVAPLEIRWIDDVLQYGAFALENIAQDAFVGEYTGLVRPISRPKHDQNSYCFHYPTRFSSWNYYMIDALSMGNETRFINHSNRPNLQPLCLVDRNLLHLVFVAQRPIMAGEQLTFNYGEDYWESRNQIDN